MLNKLRFHVDVAENPLHKTKFASAHDLLARRTYKATPILNLVEYHPKM